MNNLRAAAEKALAALEDASGRLSLEFTGHLVYRDEISDLRTALAQNPLDIADRAYFTGKQDGIEEALAQPESQVCCGDYEKCMKACTPRGQWLAEKELAQPEQEPEKFDPRDYIDPETGEPFEPYEPLHPDQLPIGEVENVQRIGGRWTVTFRSRRWMMVGEMLYTAPVSKPWVSLTDEEIWENQGLDDLVWGRNIEAALRSKNT